VERRVPVHSACRAWWLPCLVVVGWWVSTRCWVLRGCLAGLVLVGVVLGLLLVVVA